MSCDHEQIRIGRKIYIGCNCFCEDCFEGETCKCTECIHNHEVALAPAYYGAPQEAAEHTCKDCGVEVFRKGTRGRFPTKCLECKEKA